MAHSRDIEGTFDYLDWDPIFESEKPFQVLSDIPPDAPDQRTSNLTLSTGPSEIIQDVRGQEGRFSLDTHGFCYFKHKSAVSPDQMRTSKQIVEDVYLPECKFVLEANVPASDRVYIFDWRIRSSETTQQHGKSVDLSDKSVVLGPSTAPHIDTTATSVIDRVNLFMPGEADFLLSGRVRFINLWRPLSDSVQSFPLAVCDSNSLDPSYLIETHRIRKRFTDNTFLLVYHKGIKWYYKSQQQPDDLLIFKNFDSEDGVAQYSAHCAVKTPQKTEPLPVRESIEVRAVVFTYPENYATEENGLRADREDQENTE